LKDGKSISVKDYSPKVDKVVTVGLIQTAVSEDVVANMVSAEQRICEAAKRGAQIICLEELYRSRYFPQREKVDVAVLAESIPGESTRVFAALAKKFGVVIVAALFERGLENKFYNTAVVIDADGAVLGTYRKTHIPYDPYFYEKDYFVAGESNYRVFKTAYADLSVLICYDQWFPEAARICALAGAEIIFYPTAIGHINGQSSTDGDWPDAWRTVQRAHAIVNGVHVAAVNRVGVEGWLTFWGGSFICDSFGKVIAEADTNEAVVVAKVNLGLNRQIQEGWGFLRNRRPDTYASLVKPVEDAKLE